MVTQETHFYDGYLGTPLVRLGGYLGNPLVQSGGYLGDDLLLRGVQRGHVLALLLGLVGRGAPCWGGGGLQLQLLQAQDAEGLCQDLRSVRVQGQLVVGEAPWEERAVAERYGPADGSFGSWDTPRDTHTLLARSSGLRHTQDGLVDLVGDADALRVGKVLQQEAVDPEALLAVPLPLQREASSLSGRTKK